MISTVTFGCQYFRTEADVKNLILMSKRAMTYYIEKSKVMLKNKTLVYSQTFPGGKGGQKMTFFYNLPHANMSCLFLGTGTSISSSAVRFLASSNVMVGFVGGEATPLAISDSVFMPSVTYRPSAYMQSWVEIWRDDSRALEAAKTLIEKRVSFTLKAWETNDYLRSHKMFLSKEDEQKIVDSVRLSGDRASIMGIEGSWTKNAYRRLAEIIEDETFKRTRRGYNVNEEDSPIKTDEVNIRLDMGNHIAYGMASAAIHALGISFSFPLLHGNSRRGGLVFDVADIVKDALVLPLAFESVATGKTRKEYRKAVLLAMKKAEVIDVCIDVLKEIIDSAKNRRKSASGDIRCILS